MICLTDNSKSVQEEVRDILEGENLHFVEAGYSLEELSHTDAYIHETYETLYEQYVTSSSDVSAPEYILLASMNGWGIDVKANRVVISVRDITNEKKETFKTLFPDAKGIDFENGGNISGV